MSRLLPRSLAGRLVIVLLAGLLAAQAASIAIHWRDRGAMLLDLGGTNFLQRMIGITRILERIPAAQRPAMVRDLFSPWLQIELLPRFPLSQPDSAPPTELATKLEAHMRENLPQGRRVRISAPESGGMMLRSHLLPGAPMMRRHAMMQHPPGIQMMRPDFMLQQPGQGPRSRLASRRVSFAAEVELGDGSAVRFHSGVPLPPLSSHNRFLISLGVLLLAIVTLTLIVVRLATRPLRLLADGAEALGRDFSRPPLPETGPREVVTAVRALNRLQERIRQNLSERANMLAAVSHDLKTPLTRLRLRAEMLQDVQLAEEIGRDLDDMEMMVDETLEFMYGLEKREPDQPVEIDRLLAEIRSDVTAKGGKLQLHGDAGRPCHGQPLALKRCLVNLIGNAVKYGGEAEVRINNTGEALRITVLDRGPGIPQEALEQVFQPFFRLESSRSRETGGTGMGLAIARNIARLHGGDITLHNRTGGGLAAEFRLPRADG
ncbi:MAG: ATP-binding protein [Pseudomonadota bacterium]|nr:ATP-binding protein [Pseudomonadota bacterium]